MMKSINEIVARAANLNVDNLLVGQKTSTATCSACGTSLDLATDDGVCPGCGVAVCLICGCTEGVPCVQKCAGDSVLACSWQRPGVCTFCHSDAAAFAYAMATGRIPAQLAAEVSNEIAQEQRRIIVVE
jgi:hypothetical protein